MRLLIVGLGSIGVRHATNAAAIDQVEVAVYDADIERAEQVSGRLALPFFSTWDLALEWRPQAAVVAVPTSLHIPVARDVVLAGAHVLIEKPIAENLQDAADFLVLAEKQVRKVYVVCNMRFHPAITAVRTQLPRIGQPLFARAHYGNYLPDMRPGTDYRELYCSWQNMGGGVILDAIHEVDYLTWLFGPVENVYCDKAKLSDLDIDVEDYAHLNMRHKGGFRSEVHLDYLRRVKRRGLEVVGSEGSILWLSEGKNPEHCIVRMHTSKDGWNTLLEDSSLDASFIYADIMECFVREVQGEHSAMLLNGSAAKDELATVLAAHRSGITDTVVKVCEIEV